MTEKEARNKLKSYREIDEDTGEEYGYQIVKSLSPDGNGYLFECIAEFMGDSLEIELDDKLGYSMIITTRYPKQP